jgi:phage baseplate assembly protein W
MLTKDIKYNDWQLSVNNPGGVVESVNDIAQCIRTIVASVKGSDPLRPDFGIDFFKYQDRPINWAIPNVIKDVIDALTTYEPRAEILRLTPTVTQERLQFAIYWQPANKSQLDMLPEDLEGSELKLIELGGIGVMVIETTFFVF